MRSIFHMVVLGSGLFVSACQSPLTLNAPKGPIYPLYNGGVTFTPPKGLCVKEDLSRFDDGFAFMDRCALTQQSEDSVLQVFTIQVGKDDVAIQFLSDQDLIVQELLSAQGQDNLRLAMGLNQFSIEDVFVDDSLVTLLLKVDSASAPYHISPYQMRGFGALENKAFTASTYIHDLDNVDVHRKVLRELMLSLKL